MAKTLGSDSDTSEEVTKKDTNKDTKKEKKRIEPISVEEEVEKIKLKRRLEKSIKFSYEHDDYITINGNPGSDMEMGQFVIDVSTNKRVKGYPKLVGRIVVNTFIGSVDIDLGKCMKASDMLVDYTKRYDEITKTFSIYIKSNLIEMELNGIYNEGILKIENMVNFLRLNRRKEINITINKITFFNLKFDYDEEILKLLKEAPK